MNSAVYSKFCKILCLNSVPLSYPLKKNSLYGCLFDVLCHSFIIHSIHSLKLTRTSEVLLCLFISTTSLPSCGKSVCLGGSVFGRGTVWVNRLLHRVSMVSWFLHPIGGLENPFLTRIYGAKLVEVRSQTNKRLYNFMLGNCGTTFHIMVWIKQTN